MLTAILSFVTVGLWLDSVMPNKPPVIVQKVLDIPDNLRDGIKSLNKVDHTAETEAYKKLADDIRAKYSIKR